MKILLTGATGFIGSHLAELFVDKGCKLMIVKRNRSSLKNIASIFGEIKYVDVDSDDWMSQVCSFRPDVIVHSAWSGVSVQGRSDLNTQLSNIDFVNALLFISEKCQSSKFIVLGSQAEYGVLSEKVSEEKSVDPVNDYGLVKNCVLHQVRSYCELREVQWYWLRLFSVYGERESEEWLLPKVIRDAFVVSEMDFTLGKQKYAYLYVKDLAEAIWRVCKKDKAKSGVYNISSSHAMEIQKLLTCILKKMNSVMRLNLGAIPYRENQSMHIEGDSSKFINEFGEFEQTSLDEGIGKLIDFYRKNEAI